MAVLLAGTAHVQAQVTPDSLTLPVYQIEIDSVHLARLDRNPWLNETVPATFIVEGERYDCGVRYRGGTSRDLPKKSWRVEFEEDDNPLGLTHLNLNTEYRDRSAMRNHLAMTLLRYLGEVASQTRYVSLFVNGTYAGVHVQVDRVDDDFLDRAGLDDGPIFRALTHSAALAPVLNYDEYPLVWEVEEGTREDFDAFQQLLHQLTYWTDAEFEARVESVFDVDNVLTYYAAVTALVNYDGYTKNHYVHRDNDGMHRIVPWDVDGSFGNSWEGDYQPGRVQDKSYKGVRSMLFQRLLEQEKWHAHFTRRIQEVAGPGFNAVLRAADSTYALIRHDVYRDTTKIGSNEAFDVAVGTLKAFVRARRQYLEQATFEQRPRLAVEHVTPAIATPDSSRVTVSVRIEGATEPPRLLVGSNFAYEDWRVSYRKRYYTFHDDGLHDDGAAGDGVFAASFDASGFAGQTLPFAVEYQGFTYPAFGVGYDIARPTVARHAVAVRAAGTDVYRQLRFENVAEAGDERFVRLHNPTAQPLDLSGFMIQVSGTQPRRYSISMGTSVAPGETLTLASDREAGVRWFGTEGPVVGGLFASPVLGDTLRLLTPSHLALIEEVVTSVVPVSFTSTPLVITEINYNAHDSRETGDWIELYNPTEAAVDLAAWTLRDDDDAHAFRFPVGTQIEPGGYLVASRDTALLRPLYPGITSMVGDFDFGLSGGGDDVRLFDPLGALVDHVAYDDEAPWPAVADGEGATLELIHHTLDNEVPSNWMASTAMGGTPGARNSVSLSAGPEQPGTMNWLGESHPNPALSRATILYDVRTASEVELVLYDLLGRQVQVLDAGVRLPGRHRVAWQADDLAAGIYVYVLRVDGETMAARRAVVLK